MPAASHSWEPCWVAGGVGVSKEVLLHARYWVIKLPCCTLHASSKPRERRSGGYGRQPEGWSCLTDFMLMTSP